ncbi:MAG: precorrin-6A synthase (deacetylating) [Aeromicrobium erythreum]
MTGRRRLRLVGIGCGDPEQLTLEAVRALQDAAFALVTVKRDGDPLAEVRRAIIERHAPGLPVVEVVDPERDRSSSSTATTSGYEGVVGDWHEARAEAWEAALLGTPGGGAGRWAADGAGDAVLLVWGDPAFYDSTIRVVERVLARGRVGFEWDVLPGVSALQLLAARHRVVLHEVGQPVLVTTARRLREAVDAGADNLVVMLGARLDLDGLDDWTIWWGANLGAPSEALVAGRVGDVLPTIEGARAEARAAAGWVMDVYLLRR